MVASVLCGLMYQQSPIRAARLTAMSALAPIQIGGGRFLQGLDRAGRVVEFPVIALHVDEILGPQAFDREHDFFETGAELAALHAERLELDNRG